MAEHETVPVDDLTLPHAGKLLLGDQVVMPQQLANLVTGELANSTGEHLSVRIFDLHKSASGKRFPNVADPLGQETSTLALHSISSPRIHN